MASAPAVITIRTTDAEKAPAASSFPALVTVVVAFVTGIAVAGLVGAFPRNPHDERDDSAYHMTALDSN